MNDSGYIVAGWYTPDYTPWANNLRRSLDRFGEPHDIVQVEPMTGGWERNTMRKPAQILAAMKRHPDRQIVFLDVDCEVLAPLDCLGEIRADIAVHLMVARRSRGYGRMFGRSTTMVLNQTGPARAMVREWVRLSDKAPLGYVDQHTLTEAIANTPMITVANLGAEYCAMTKDDVVNPIIAHAGAARSAVKIPGWIRAMLAFEHSVRLHRKYNS